MEKKNLHLAFPLREQNERRSHPLPPSNAKCSTPEHNINGSRPGEADQALRRRLRVAGGLDAEGTEMVDLGKAPARLLKARE